MIFLKGKPFIPPFALCIYICLVLLTDFFFLKLVHLLLFCSCFCSASYLIYYVILVPEFSKCRVGAEDTWLESKEICQSMMQEEDKQQLQPNNSLNGYLGYCEKWIECIKWHRESNTDTRTLCGRYYNYKIDMIKKILISIRFSPFLTMSSDSYFIRPVSIYFLWSESIPAKLFSSLLECEIREHCNIDRKLQHPRV